jgi:ABC-2 type transport system ATP-binding protein
VIIVDNGELLLQANLADIAGKLSFRMVDFIEDESKILYSEPSLKGHAIVTENKTGEESKVNLEFLFNAVTANPEKSKLIFQTK